MSKQPRLRPKFESLEGRRLLAGSGSVAVIEDATIAGATAAVDVGSIVTGSNSQARAGGSNSVNGVIVRTELQNGGDADGQAADLAIEDAADAQDASGVGGGGASEPFIRQIPLGSFPTLGRVDTDATDEYFADAATDDASVGGYLKCGDILGASTADDTAPASTDPHDNWSDVQVMSMPVTRTG